MEVDGFATLETRPRRQRGGETPASATIARPRARLLLTKLPRGTRRIGGPTRESAHTRRGYGNAGPRGKEGRRSASRRGSEGDRKRPPSDRIPGETPPAFSKPRFPNSPAPPRATHDNRWGQAPSCSAPSSPASSPAELRRLQPEKPRASLPEPPFLPAGSRRRFRFAPPPFGPLRPSRPP